MWPVIWDKLIWPWISNIGHFVRNKPLPLIFGLIVGLGCFVIGEWYVRSLSREIVVLLGPRASNGRYLGNRIADKLEVTSSAPGVGYSVTRRVTGGYDEMRDIIYTDNKGLTVGFGVDDGDNELRVLLPLDWDYVHVLVRADFVTQHCKDKRPKDLGELTSFIKERRVFFGTRGSASRRVGEAILGYYTKDVNKLSCLGVEDWEDVRGAFQCGEIDVAFFVGQLGSTAIYDMAWDGNTIIVSLNSIADAVSRDNKNGVVKAAFAGNTYRASPLSNGLLFCDGDVTTLAARRLVITNRHMTEFDAFVISGAIRDALEGDVPIDPWNVGDPVSLNPNRAQGIRTLDHPGAALIRNKLTYVRWWVPSSWPSSVRGSVFGILSFICALLLSWLSDKLKDKDQSN